MKNGTSRFRIGYDFPIRYYIWSINWIRIRKGKNKITQKTTLDILINGVGTNLNYGKSNSGLADYKKPALGIQAGLSLQVGFSSDFSIVSELYFMMRGGKLKANNPLTNTESTLRFYSVELPVWHVFILANSI